MWSNVTLVVVWEITATLARVVWNLGVLFPWLQLLGLITCMIEPGTRLRQIIWRFFLERFPLDHECRNSHSSQSEITRKIKWTKQCERANRDWFWSSLWLVEKVALDLFKLIAKHSEAKTNARYFWYFTENRSIYLFRLGGLLPHFRPCDDTLENSSVQIFK